MEKISLITQRSMDEVNGSTARPRWQIDALNDNGFTDIQMIDKFDKTKLKNVSNTLIHAHQFSGRWLENEKYLVDIHGLEHIQSLNLSAGYPIHSWKKYAFIAKSVYYKKFELKLFKKAVHLICSGEDIQEKVEKIQNSTLIRNSLFLKDFPPTECLELRVALVGPFMPGTINYDGLHLIKKTIQNLPNIKFIIIGKTDDSFKNQLNFKNVEFLGIVKNYHDALRSCSVLLSPYPEHAKYLGSKNKFLEAAACEMPVITTPSGAIDFNKDLLLIGDNPKKLADLIMSQKDENERRKLGKNLRNEIKKKYNADIEVKKIIKLYNEFSN